jgi:hypothetical protein
MCCDRQGSSNEARIKACSELSNLSIGYDNKIPNFAYPGFVDAILNVNQTELGEACSILWSFVAEMKNQIPVSCLQYDVLILYCDFYVLIEISCPSLLQVVQCGDILPILVRVLEENGTTEACAIVGGGCDDALSATLAVRAVESLS